MNQFMIKGKNTNERCEPMIDVSDIFELVSLEFCFLKINEAKSDSRISSDSVTV